MIRDLSNLTVRLEVYFVMVNLNSLSLLVVRLRLHLIPETHYFYTVYIEGVSSVCMVTP